MGGSSDMKRLNNDLFGTNNTNQGTTSEVLPTSKPLSSSATSEVLDAVKQGGNLKPTTYRGMKLGKDLYKVEL